MFSFSIKLNYFYNNHQNQKPKSRMSKCCNGCYPAYNFSQFAHMGIGGCQECYDTSYKNETFNTSEYIDAINKSLLQSISQCLQEEKQDDCSICYEKIGKTNNCTTECGHKFCLKCIIIFMERSNTCPMCRYELKDK